MQQDKPQRQDQSKWQQVISIDVVSILVGIIVLLLAMIGDEYLSLPSIMAMLLGSIRLILGILFVLYIPGYCLSIFFFPDKSSLTQIERVGLSLGLSVALIPIIAFGLDLASWGLRLWPIFITEFVLISVFLLLGLWRQTRIDDNQFDSDVHVVDVDKRETPPLMEKMIYGVCGVVLISLTGILLWFIVDPFADKIGTEFYMLGETGRAEYYPHQVQVDDDIAVTIGISNNENKQNVYNVEILVVDTWSNRSHKVIETDSIVLAANSNYEDEIVWQMPWDGKDQIVEIYLYNQNQQQSNDDEPYRQLRLWVDVFK
ncbi:MAG TPA: DUF1616 domain-containing protein [Anaerolineae bacterium]|nr:DUF1616 domain-containing protein [Anaerolineae bacterium]